MVRKTVHIKGFIISLSVRMEFSSGDVEGDFEEIGNFLVG